MSTALLSSVSIDGRDVRSDELVREDGRVVGVRLGNIAAHTSVRIDVTYELPEGLTVLPGQEPVLQVEVFRAPSKTVQDT